MKVWISLLVVCALTTHSSKAHAEIKSDKSFTIGTSQEIDTLHPMIWTMTATLYVYNMIARTLVSQDKKMLLVPQLAESIPTLENKQAKITKVDGVSKIIATWNIKQNAKWGDGVSINCNDFAFTKKVSLSENVAVASREPYNKVEKIECDSKNPKRVKITYRNTVWDFNRMLQFYLLPSHLEEAIFNQHGKDKLSYDSHSLYTTQPTNPGLYSGPYIVTDVKIGSHMQLKANPFFWGPQPKIKSIIIKIIPNTSTLESNLYSGTIDMIGIIGVTLDQVLGIEDNLLKNNKPYIVQYEEGLNYEHIDLNLNNEILKNLNIRRALNFAIDRKTLVTSFFKNKKRPAYSFLSPKDPWFDSRKIQERYPYSVQKANGLLEMEGWKKSEDGFRYKNGVKLSLPFVTTAGSKTRETIQLYLIDQWKKVGVEVLVKNAPARTMFDSVIKRQYPAMAMYAISFMPEPSLSVYYHSKNIPSVANAWSGRNTTGWANEKVDQLLEKIDSEMNFNQRKKIASQIANLYMDEAPTIPLYYRLDSAVIPKNLKGFHLTGFQQLDSLDVENWVLN